MIAADTDPPLHTSEYQAGLDEVERALQVHVKVSSLIDIQEAVDAPSFLMGSFTIESVKSVGLVVGPIIGAWLQARYGRKVRLKIGDIEAEARTVSEVEELLERAEKVHPRIRE